MRRSRPTVAPHGVPVCVQFYGHNPGEPYAAASKIKTLDVHPVLPLVVTADEEGTITVWDYSSECIVMRFNVDSVKEGQRAAVEAIDAHSAFAAAHAFIVPDTLGPGIGVGPPTDPGSTIGPAVEGFLAAITATTGTPTSSRPVSRARAGGDGDSAGLRAGRAGAVRSVCFGDEHVIALYGGAGRGDYDDYRVGSESASVADGDFEAPRFAQPLQLASSASDIAAMLSAGTEYDSNVPMMARSGLRAPQQWLIVVCESRTLVVDMASRGTIDVPHAALLVELNGGAIGGGGGGAIRTTVVKGKPAAFSAAPLGPGVLAFGCEDGAIRVWAADVGAVIQTLRSGGAVPSSSGAAAAGSTSGRPVTHMSVVSLSPHAVGSTVASLTPSSASGTAARAGRGRSLLVAGSADGAIATWEVFAGGRQVAPVPTSVLRLGSDLVHLSVSPLTLQAVALGADKSLAMWDVSARPSASGGAPPRALLASRVTTSSAAAETGAGSRLSAAVSLGAHPFFPPSTLLVAGKGPHLELLAPGGPDRSAESGTVFVDLRTARPGLPPKLKVYVLAAHPFRPDIVVCGTNVGVFAISLAPGYGVGVLSASHPTWALPTTTTEAPLLPQPTSAIGTTTRSSSSGITAAGGSASLSAEGKGGAGTQEVAWVREGRVVVHATAAGSLIATEVTAATPAEPEDDAHVCSGERGCTGVVHGGGGSTQQVDARTHEHVLLPNFAPPGSPPATLPGGGANALSALLAQAKAASAPPGSRGVRIRVSGSGRYISAVWPEHRCFAIYRLNFGRAAAMAPGGGGTGDPRDWNAEYVEGGPGLDVAWSGPTVTHFTDTFTPAAANGGVATAKQGDESSVADRPMRTVVDSDGEVQEHRRRESTASDEGVPAAVVAMTPNSPPPPRMDRYVVLEPGVPVTGRGPMGGGMAIGTAPTPTAGRRVLSGAPKVKAGASAAGSSTILSPSSLVLKELPAPPAFDFRRGVSHTAAAIPKPVTLIARVPLSQEPVAVWGGGPVLAVAVASDSSGPGGSATLGAASLQFYGWGLADPPPRSAEEEARDAALAARYSGLASGGAGGRQPRLLPVGSTAATPAPAAAGQASGCGALWSSDGSRVAICTSTAVHIFAVTSSSTIPTAAVGSNAKVAQATVSELCRVPLVAYSATWDEPADGSARACGLLCSTSDARIVLLLPPSIIEPHLLCDGDALSAAQRSRNLAPLILEIQVLVPVGVLPAMVPTACSLPSPRRGTANPALCHPVCIARHHALTLHWCGPRGGSSATSVVKGGGACSPTIGIAAGLVVGTLPLVSPALRALRALSSSTRSVYINSSESAANDTVAAAYAAATVAAAKWASRLQVHAQDDMGQILASLGGLSAALLLPGLQPEHGIHLALSRRTDAFAATPISGVVAVDIAVAVAYLCRLAHGTLNGGGGAAAADTFQGIDGSSANASSALLSLAGPVGQAVNSTRDDGLAGVGVWPQVAAFLAIASRSVAADAAPRISAALRVLTRRCIDSGLMLDAALVAAAGSGCAPAVEDANRDEHDVEYDLSQQPTLLFPTKFSWATLLSEALAIESSLLRAIVQ